MCYASKIKILAFAFLFSVCVYAQNIEQVFPKSSISSFLGGSIDSVAALKDGVGVVLLGNVPWKREANEYFSLKQKYYQRFLQQKDATFSIEEYIKTVGTEYEKERLDRFLANYSVCDKTDGGICWEKALTVDRSGGSICLSFDPPVESPIGYIMIENNGGTYMNYCVGEGERCIVRGAISVYMKTQDNNTIGTDVFAVNNQNEFHIPSYGTLPWSGFDGVRPNLNSTIENPINIQAYDKFIIKASVLNRLGNIEDCFNKANGDNYSEKHYNIYIGKRFLSAKHNDIFPQSCADALQRVSEYSTQEGWYWISADGISEPTLQYCSK